MRRPEPLRLNYGQPALRCGVLIVGSLYWENDERGIRDAWRKSRLDLDCKIHVKSPIRYGRRSDGWGRAFTMIFDASAGVGQGILVPCCGPIATFDDLLNEVSWLWAAEDRNPPCKRFHKQWGCVGALFGPRAKTSELHEKWKAHFQSARPQAAPAIDREGRLDIPWPNTPDGTEVTDIDIILGTATWADPADERPKPKEIASAWIEQAKRHERYFIENVRHGIRTEDDRQIWEFIEKGKPGWLECGAYDSVIEQLRAEAEAPMPTREV